MLIGEAHQRQRTLAGGPTEGGTAVRRETNWYVNVISGRISFFINQASARALGVIQCGTKAKLGHLFG